MKYSPIIYGALFKQAVGVTAIIFEASGAVRLRKLFCRTLAEERHRQAPEIKIKLLKITTEHGGTN